MELTCDHGYSLLLLFTPVYSFILRIKIRTFIWPRREERFIECNFWADSSVVLPLFPYFVICYSFPFFLNVKDSEWIFNLAEFLVKLQILFFKSGLGPKPRFFGTNRFLGKASIHLGPHFK